MTLEELEDVFQRAAGKALFVWKKDYEEGQDDLVSDLWVWYLESPATQKKLQDADIFLARNLVYKRSLQILARQSLADDKFNGRNLYSSESVKDSLLGVSNNRYLNDIMPMAWSEMHAQNEDYAEAITSRYTDGEIPHDKRGQNLLFRAHKSLTEHVNVIAITAGVDSDGNVSEGPGSRHAVFPDTRRTNYGHADPTANIALMLIDHPELRDDYFEELPLTDFLKGKDAQPVRLDV